MARPQRARGEVMVVEDDYSIRETLRELLEEQGYHVLQAANGAEALARLRDAATPQLILLDLMMPVMDGWEFRRAIQGDPRLGDIPVVVISAEHALEQKVRALDVEGYLEKPFELARLLATVEHFAHA